MLDRVTGRRVSAAGITSEVVHFRQPHSTKIALVAWIRELPGTRNVLYAGACIKVVFPLTPWSS